MRLRACGALVLLGLALCLTAPGGAQDFLDKSFDKWRKELIGGQAPARRSAAFALGRMGALASDALDSLTVRAKDDPDVVVRETCALASARIIREMVRTRSTGLTTNMLDRLREALKRDGDPRVRRSAAVAV